MAFWLGIEGGGTKTDFGWRGSAGEPGGWLRKPGSSRSRRSEAEVEKVLRAGCTEVLQKAGAAAGDCVAVCGGFASAGTYAEFYRRTLAALLPRARVRVMTDAELAWWAAAGGGDGIVVIAGTGSIAWGGYGGRQARAGGEGPGQAQPAFAGGFAPAASLWSAPPGRSGVGRGDAGSGDWIGRAAVAEGLLAAPEDGEFAGLVPALAQLGTPQAEALLRRAGAELAGLLLSCARELGWAAPAAYFAGGVVEDVPQVRAALAACWPHSLAALPRRPLEAALELARALG